MANIQSELEGLENAALISRDGRASQTLVHQPPVKVVLMALRQGASLKPHQAPEAMSLQVVKGRVEITVVAEEETLQNGGILLLDKGTPHSLCAVDDSALLITLVDASTLPTATYYSRQQRERELFLKLEAAVRDQDAWTKRQVLTLIKRAEAGTPGTGAAWSRLKAEVPKHTEWPTARVIALLIRLQSGLEPVEAGSSELLHSGD